MCLARFDELKQLGLDKFTREYDPYWDIPLNENLPKPVIDLPIPTEVQQPTAAEPAEGLFQLAAEDDGEYRLTGKPKRKRPSRKKT